MPELEDLYQEIILDHNRRPRHFGVLKDATHHAEGYNPLCGDQVTVYLHLDGDTIRDISFDGQGCAISRASASLMTSRLRGKSVAEARALMHDVQALLTSPETEAPPPDEFGDLAALAGVRRFAARVKCATLAWRTLEAALARGGSVTTE